MSSTIIQSDAAGPGRFMGASGRVVVGPDGRIKASYSVINQRQSIIEATKQELKNEFNYLEDARNLWHNNLINMPNIPTLNPRVLAAAIVVYNGVNADQHQYIDAYIYYIDIYQNIQTLRDLLTNGITEESVKMLENKLQIIASHSDLNQRVVNIIDDLIELLYEFARSIGQALPVINDQNPPSETTTDTTTGTTINATTIATRLQQILMLLTQLTQNYQPLLALARQNFLQQFETVWPYLNEKRRSSKKDKKERKSPALYKIAFNADVYKVYTALYNYLKSV